jgi:ubiquinone/menaquinone biosynthesis C-methylase UbiE
MTGGGENLRMNDPFELYYERYDAWYENNRNAYLSEIEAVRVVLPPGGRGLEIGVGTGRFAAPLDISKGIDPSGKMISLARERGVDAERGRGEELNFGDNEFDLVALIVTICFVEEPEKVLRESERVLKPNGRIIVGIIDRESVIGKELIRKKSVFYANARFYSVKEILEMLKKSGFGSFDIVQTLFRPLGSIDSIEPPESGYGKGSFVVISGNKQR